MRTGSSSHSFSDAVAPRPQSRAYLLLVLATLTWGANAVAARLAVGEVSPMMLTFSRWIVCCLALALSSRREISTHWRALRPAWLHMIGNVVAVLLSDNGRLIERVQNAITGGLPSAAR